MSTRGGGSNPHFSVQRNDTSGCKERKYYDLPGVT